MSQTILVIDDDWVFLQKLDATLTETGYRVFKATNAKAGMALLRKLGDQIDLVIADLVLPDSSGQQIIAEVSRASSHIKIIAITGILSEEQLTIMKYIGADAVLRKPKAGAPFASEWLQTVAALLSEERAQGGT